MLPGEMISDFYKRKLVKAILSGEIAINVSFFKWSSQCPCLQTIALDLEATNFKNKIFLLHNSGVITQIKKISIPILGMV